MIILGLGSNIGDRLNHLRKALQTIKNIPHLTVQQVSPIYLSDALLPDNAPRDWDQPYLNAALRCETTLDPLELLKQLKNIEWSIGRKPEIRHWGPRILDIDILAWDDRVIKSDLLTIPHENLLHRPFALWPLADIAPFWLFPLSGSSQNKTAAEMIAPWGSRFTGQAPFHTRQIHQRIDTPQLVGILNITPDSFSDGGQFLSADSAVQQAIYLVASGAEIIDIGAQSTAPHATSIGAKEEWQKLEPVLTGINDARDQFILTPKISVDTYHVTVAKQALQWPVDWINDVSGLKDPAMIELLAQSKADSVMMHHLSIPASHQQVIPYDQDAMKIIYKWAEKQLNILEKLGIARERMIVDPGIGFGKVAEHSFLLIKHIKEFKNLGVRLLVGHSRKSFLSLFTAHPASERDMETVITALHLANHAVDYLRVHHVEWCARGLKIAAAL
ncbi:MAG TPA: dihydropteroate synthase [Gammaproteobacteria bacterium]|nr:dihydropteroate synthase [Gammaproteobacteria bacterium]